jgi:hypothetical protein
VLQREYLHFPFPFEIALQWQRNSGNVFSEYGASPSRLAWQILYLHYL